MTKQIGISYYPDFYDDKKCIEILDYAYDLGYRVIFTSLILNDYGFENTVEGISEKTQFFLDYAAKKGIEVHADVTRKILYQLGASVEDLSKLEDLNIPVIRLDGGFDDDEVIQLTLNRLDIRVEENLSNYRILSERLERVDEEGNIDNYLACHNFYPRNDTGIRLEDAVKAAEIFQDYHVRTGIFIGSQASKSDLNQLGQSTMTVEAHRYLPSEVQLMELLSNEVFDYFIFGDSHPSVEELQAVSQTFKDFIKEERPIITIPCYFEDLPEEVLDTIQSTVFSVRTDVSDKVIRGTQTRGLINLEKDNIYERIKGAITIDNNESLRYGGELQIALENYPPTKNANVVGYVKPYARRLLPYLKNINYQFKLKG